MGELSGSGILVDSFTRQSGPQIPSWSAFSAVHHTRQPHWSLVLPTRFLTVTYKSPYPPIGKRLSSAMAWSPLEASRNWQSAFRHWKINIVTPEYRIAESFSGDLIKSQDGGSKRSACPSAGGRLVNIEFPPFPFLLAAFQELDLRCDLLSQFLVKHRIAHSLSENI